MDLLLITNNEKLHYLYVKDFNKFICIKTKHKNKKHLRINFLQCISHKRVFVDHREICLKINGKQGIKLRNKLINFDNHCKQVMMPFKLYAGFE